MQRIWVVEIESALQSPATVVWEAVGKMEGVNEELGPWMRMTFPKAYVGRHLREAPLDQLLFRSVLLALGILPFDVHFLKLRAVTKSSDSSFSFWEESSSLVQKSWEHRRWVEERGQGCVLRDRVTVEPRIAIAGKLVSWFVGTIFRHRHRKLKALFGTER